ncbi:hypothetical protein B0H14DRAFT_2602813 [Mycena olivaceomarginata]|nr:hypothetical protein B0H14DRAFT_2602813 [Mycena olivaceomarginata]
MDKGPSIGLLVRWSIVTILFSYTYISAIQTNNAETHLECAASTAKRFGTGSTMSKRPPPGTFFDTNMLLQHEHGGGTPGEDKITIAWAVRESKATLVQRNGLFLFHCQISRQIWWRHFYSEEVTFRFHGGTVLEPKTANMTFSEFYAFYSSPSRASIFLSNVPSVWKALARANRGPILFLELYIDSKMASLQFNYELSSGQCGKKADTQQHLRRCQSERTYALEWEEDVPVSNGRPGRRVDLNSLGDKGLLVDVVKKQRWSGATSYIRPPDQPQPPVTACHSLST